MFREISYFGMVYIRLYDPATWDSDEKSPLLLGETSELLISSLKEALFHLHKCSSKYSPCRSSSCSNQHNNLYSLQQIRIGYHQPRCPPIYTTGDPHKTLIRVRRTSSATPAKVWALTFRRLMMNPNNRYLPCRLRSNLKSEFEGYSVVLNCSCFH